MKHGTPGAVSAFALLLLGGVVAQHEGGGQGLVPMKLRPADFVVTSAHDAGPGTLREAILAADRLSSRAHIEIAVGRLAIESALPAFTNPHGIDLDARPGAGTIDAERQASGAALQVNAPTSTVRGLTILNAHGTAIIVNAAGVTLDSLTVTDSKIAILLSPAAAGGTIRGATFDRDETAVMAQAGVRDLGISASAFRHSTRAGFWFVGAADEARPATPQAAPERERAHLIDDEFTQNASGIVLANEPTLVQRARFAGNRESAVLVLGGGVRIEDCDVRGSGGAAISVTGGRGARLARNTLTDNAATAILVRDSEVTIEHNTLTHNGVGVVSITTQGTLTPVLRDNTITRTETDAIVVIGGGALVEGNRLLENHGAVLKALDLVDSHGTSKAAPQIGANTFRGNGVDHPVSGVYKLPAAP